jgi:hypothetical protein
MLRCLGRQNTLLRLFQAPFTGSVYYICLPFEMRRDGSIYNNNESAEMEMCLKSFRIENSIHQNTP